MLQVKPLLSSIQNTQGTHEHSEMMPLAGVKSWKCAMWPTAAATNSLQTWCQADINHLNRGRPNRMLDSVVDCSSGLAPILTINKHLFWSSIRAEAEKIRFSILTFFLFNESTAPRRANAPRRGDNRGWQSLCYETALTQSPHHPQVKTTFTLCCLLLYGELSFLTFRFTGSARQTHRLLIRKSKDDSTQTSVTFLYLLIWGTVLDCFL